MTDQQEQKRKASQSELESEPRKGGKAESARERGRQPHRSKGDRRSRPGHSSAQDNKGEEQFERAGRGVNVSGGRADQDDESADLLEEGARSFDGGPQLESEESSSDEMEGEDDEDARATPIDERTEKKRHVASRGQEEEEPA